VPGSAYFSFLVKSLIPTKFLLLNELYESLNFGAFSNPLLVYPNANSQTPFFLKLALILDPLRDPPSLLRGPRFFNTTTLLVTSLESSLYLSSVLPFLSPDHPLQIRLLGVGRGLRKSGLLVRSVINALFPSNWFASYCFPSSPLAPLPEAISASDSAYLPSIPFPHGLSSSLECSISPTQSVPFLYYRASKTA